MLKEISIDDGSLISSLESNFKDVFLTHHIKDDLINNPFSKYLVYIKDDKIMGFINYTYIYDRIEIININVKDDYKRQGIGSKLLTEVLNNKVINFTLEVNKTNLPAITFYKNHGFKEIAIRKNYYNGTDGILMEKS